MGTCVHSSILEEKNTKLQVRSPQVACWSAGPPRSQCPQLRRGVPPGGVTAPRPLRGRGRDGCVIL